VAYSIAYPTERNQAEDSFDSWRNSCQNIESCIHSGVLTAMVLAGYISLSGEDMRRLQAINVKLIAKYGRKKSAVAQTMLSRAR